MSRINLTDNADTIVRKIRKARTDPFPIPETLAELEGRPEAANLVRIHAALAGIEEADVLERFAGKPFSEFKPALAELAVSCLEPISDGMSRFLADPAEVDRVLADGSERAAAIANPILDRTFENPWDDPKPIPGALTCLGCGSSCRLAVARGVPRRSSGTVRP